MSSSTVPSPGSSQGPEPGEPVRETVLVRGSAIDAGERVATGLITSFSAAPGFLALVLLNVAMILAAAYYLARQETNRINTANQVTGLLRLCIEQYRKGEASP
jgi:hypothetical protein